MDAERIFSEKVICDIVIGNAVSPGIDTAADAFLDFQRKGTRFRKYINAVFSCFCTVSIKSDNTSPFGLIENPVHSELIFRIGNLLCIPAGSIKCNADVFIFKKQSNTPLYKKQITGDYRRKDIVNNL